MPQNLMCKKSALLQKIGPLKENAYGGRVNCSPSLVIISLMSEHFLQSCLGLREVSHMSHFTVGVFTQTLIIIWYQIFSELHFPYPTKPYIPIYAAMTIRIPSSSKLMLTQLDCVKGHIWGPISWQQWHERIFIHWIIHWIDPVMSLSGHGPCWHFPCH